MGKTTIRLTEGQLKSIISESIKGVLNEWTDIATFPKEFIMKKGREWQTERLKKEAEKHPDLDPTGFQWFGNTIKHNGKKKPKGSGAQRIAKPKGMSEEEYEKTIVIPNNEKYAQKVNEHPDEEFRPLVNGGRYFGGEADYGNFYEVSNYGRLKILNHENCLRSDIVDGYPAPTRNAMQFHLNFSGKGDDSMKTCPAVHYMVANAFLGEHDPKEWKVVHLDGDWRNNVVDNLKWVPKKQ